ncbi:RdRP-domain-containing protein [Backusella circina FSU 941]|nr:RdRP-domain-containing protein [Backusella circina FSU 941]
MNIDGSTDLDPLILRCCKQVYNHLSISSRIQQLKKETVPIEVQKMKALFSLDPQELDQTVRQFLQQLPPPSGKKNIGIFIKLLNTAISNCAPSFEALYEEEVFYREGSLKRTRDDSMQTANEDFHMNKRMRPQLAVNTFDLYSTHSSNDTIISANSINSNYNVYMNTSSNTSMGSLVSSPGEITPAKTMQLVRDSAKDDDEIKPEELNQEAMKDKTNNKEEEEEDDEEEEITTNKKYNLPFLQGLDKVTIISHPQIKFFDKIPWFITYEIARFVHTLKISWDDLTFKVLQTFFEAANESKPRLHEVMMEWNKERRNEKIDALAYTMIEKAPSQVWSFFSNIKDNGETSKKTRQYRDIPKISTKPPIMLLQPPALCASNRFFRKYGSERFLEMKYVKEAHTNMFSKQCDYYLKPFILMERIYKFLFMKDHTVIFFATEGPGLDTISIKQVIDWHMPIIENWSMEINKYASRMSLGYSNSIPTIAFKPQQIEYIEDVYSDIEGQNKESSCMTDGCGIISCSAMKKIMGCQVADELPCAIQGRIAGAKGVWVIDPSLDFNSGDFIQIRSSQNKFKTGMLQEDMEEDPLHYTFDLVKNGQCTYPACLNTQVIQCLAVGGVPTKVFEDLLKEYIHRIRSVITANKSVKILRDWVSKCGNLMADRWEKESNVKKGFWNSRTLDDTYDEDEDYPFSSSSSSFNSWINILSSSVKSKDNKYSGQPGSPYEVVVRLLDSGFDLTNSYVSNRITHIFREIMRSITTKYKIEVEQSCTVTCIPDPTGTLEPGQVFLQISKRKKDENTGIKVGLITGDVIVTRNPCGLKSDIQKVECVDNLALRMYTDVIVFPIKGPRSLANQLSGGDYDGDIIFCCWDERIVKPFTSSPPCNDSKRVSKAFTKDKGTVGSKLPHDQKNIESTIQRCFFSTVIPDGTLGAYENWRTVLAEKTSLDNEEVVYLAQMCSKLVDAPKQGLRLKHEVKIKDKKTYSTIPYPAWFMDKRNKQRAKGKAEYKEVNDVYTIQNAPCETTMDYLYKTLLEETEGFTRYSRNIFNEADIFALDVDLTSPWIKATQFDDEYLKADLKLIEEKYCKQVAQLQIENQRYADAMHNPCRYRTGQLKFDSTHELEDYFAKDFLDIPKELKSDIMLCDIEANGGNMIRSISASYAYKLSVSSKKYSKYCYIVAFDIIRRIKSDACAKRVKSGAYAETVTSTIYKAMSVDKLWIYLIFSTSCLSTESSL